MTDIRAAVDRVLPSVRADLEELIRIPSISALPEHRADIDRSAAFVADRLRELGGTVEIVEEGGMPAVLADFPGPEGAPTVVLYAHHDVQPTGPEADWTTGPFEPTERDNRLYARGAADDKGGVGLHLGVLRAFDGQPPVNVKVLIEGEEEIGSPTLADIFAKHGDKLACDLFIIADSSNWKVGTPAFTTTLRGSAELTVDVATLSHGLHSGQFGGLVPDALMVLTRMLASLHDDAGNVAVDGFVTRETADLDYSEADVRADTGVLDGVELIGCGSAVQRIWGKPSITVIGIDTTPVAEASPTLIPSARAKVSIRVAPGDDAREAQQRVIEHLRAHTPFGASVEFTLGDAGNGFDMPLTGEIATTAREVYGEVWGVTPVETGMGGSIPLANQFHELHPEAVILLTAVTDPHSRMHSTDESLHLGDFKNAITAEALLLARLGEAASA